MQGEITLPELDIGDGDNDDVGDEDDDGDDDNGVQTIDNASFKIKSN